MPHVACTLLADGPFDAALIPILQWTLEAQPGIENASFVWADLSRLPRPPRDLGGKIVAALALYRCDVLFVHRDAENQPPERRRNEIRDAMVEARRAWQVLPYVCVVPVRMSEAWFLLDECAIRQAAGNPNGAMPLTLPRANQVEEIPDPKAVLREVLRTASNRNRRRLKTFRVAQAARLVPQYMVDFKCLRVLSAFRQLEADVQRLAAELATG